VAANTFAPVDPESAGTGEHHDVVIVGAGAAGMSCALECFDIQLDTIVLEADAELAGQIREIPHRVRNVAAGVFEDGQSLRAALERSATILGGRVRCSAAVTTADLASGWVESGRQRYTGRAVVIATGSEMQRLPAAVDGAFGGDVTYQLESQPERFVGRVVVVIGGGDSATLDALALARSGSKVKLVHRSDRLTARLDIVTQVDDEAGIEQLAGWELEGIRGEDRLEEVRLVRPATGQRRRLDAGGLVVKISRLPRTSVFRSQLELDRAGALVVDRDLRTSLPGVFAAGDVVAGSYWRIAAAFGHGSLAARSVLRYLEGRS
jgi:thioredoxin reductase (NADPH)